MHVSKWKLQQQIIMMQNLAEAYPWEGIIGVWLLGNKSYSIFDES